MVSWMRFFLMADRPRRLGAGCDHCTGCLHTGAERSSTQRTQDAGAIAPSPAANTRNDKLPDVGVLDPTETARQPTHRDGDGVLIST